MFFAFLCNLIVSAMLILGGSATVTDLTGMPTLAACFLIPLSVAFYVYVGGMRATLLCDYIHTSVLLCIILAFMFTVYSVSDKIGSPSNMWDLLQAAAERAPVAGNAGGSYLTLRSKNGLIFAVLNLVGNFGTVYLDEAYWQRAIASKPATAVKAFTLGGSAWFAVPFGMATTMGLCAVALTGTPSFPGFPSALSASEVSAGLPAPAAAAALLGQTGAILMLVLLFLAVTSATSAEIVAVAALGSYDVYKRYINPNTTDKQVLRVDHICIGIYAVVMGLLGLIFFYIGIGMGFLYELMGSLIGSAVAPVALGIMSRRANKWGCIGGAWAGLVMGIVAWLVTAATLNDGKLTVETTGQDYPMLAGNLASIGVGTIVSVVSTLIWPEDYDFSNSIYAADVVPSSSSGSVTHEDQMHSPSGEEKKFKDGDDIVPTVSKHEVDESAASAPSSGEDTRSLKKAFRFAAITSSIMVLVLIILIPLPLFFTSHIYSPSGFTAWVVVSFIWVFYAVGAVVLYPIYESRQALAQIATAAWRDLTGKGRSE